MLEQLDKKELVPFGQNEVSTVSLSQAAMAEIQTAFLMAFKIPRNIEQARISVLDSCKRPKFAESAIYRKPVGKKEIDGRWEMQYAEGLSIRAAEEVIRVWGNIRTKVTTIYEDAEVKRFIVGVVDLQSNAGYADEITLYKTKERKKLKKGEIAISERGNSKGDVIYIVNCTPDDIKQKQNSEVSKSLRNSALRLIPVDIKEEIEEVAKETMAGKIRENITDSRKKILDAFHSLGIDPTELEKYLGHKISTVTEKQIIDLRNLYTALRDGETSWNSIMDSKESEKAEKVGINLKAAKVKEEKVAKKREKVKAPEEAKEAAVETKKVEEPAEKPVKEASETDESKEVSLGEYQQKIKDALLELSGGDETEARKMLVEITDTDNIGLISDKAAKNIYESRVKATLAAERKRNRVE